MLQLSFIFLMHRIQKQKPNISGFINFRHIFKFIGILEVWNIFELKLELEKEFI
jgi:hypothetical protein